MGDREGPLTAGTVTSPGPITRREKGRCGYRSCPPGPGRLMGGVGSSPGGSARTATGACSVWMPLCSAHSNLCACFLPSQGLVWTRRVLLSANHQRGRGSLSWGVAFCLGRVPAGAWLPWEWASGCRGLRGQFRAELWAGR